MVPDRLEEVVPGQERVLGEVVKVEAGWEECALVPDRVGAVFARPVGRRLRIRERPLAIMSAAPNAAPEW